MSWRTPYGLPERFLWPSPKSSWTKPGHFPLQMTLKTNLDPGSVSGKPAGLDPATIGSIPVPGTIFKGGLTVLDKYLTWFRSHERLLLVALVLLVGHYGVKHYLDNAASADKT